VVLVVLGAAAASVWLIQPPVPKAPPAAPVVNTGTAYDAIAKLPDWSGVWLADAAPDVIKQDVTIPLTPEYAAKLTALREAAKAGGTPVSDQMCKPYGMPLSMSHQGVLYEFLFAPDHVMINSEAQETRNIFTDRDAAE